MTASINGQSIGNFGPTKNGLGSDARWPDPFCDMASTAMPTSIQEALRWCEYLLNSNGVYRQAIERVISYFITEVEISDKESNRVGGDEHQKYKAFLEDTIGIKSVLHSVALDFLCYGNSFTSLLTPFRRYLSCKQCGFEAPLKKIYNTEKFNFSWRNFAFNATCPCCGYVGEWRHIDRRSEEEGAVKVKRWSPHEIDLIWDPFTDEVSYVWKIPEEYRTLIRQGHLHHLERASWEVIQAVKHNQNLLFDRDVVYHMREYTLAGMRNRGWGLSRVLTNFRIAWYLQLLWRYNEAIALDYVVPFRVLTPDSRPGASPESSDPVHSINLGGFVGRVNRLLAEHRRDPAKWNVLPVALKYQALGGEATELAPKDLIDQGLDTLLTSIGVPVEFYKGSLSVQAAPAALRLFEANWAYLVHSLNVFVTKLVQQVSKVLRWEPVSARMTRVTHADDLNRQMAKLQLMMGNQISKTTGLESVGLDHAAETRRMLDEAELEGEEQQKKQKELEQKAQTDELMDMLAPSPTEQLAQQLSGAQGGGGAPAGGAPAAPGGGSMTAVDQFLQNKLNNPRKGFTTPEELEAQAQAICDDLIQRPDAQRRGELAKLRKGDRTIHGLVTSMLDEKRREIDSQASQQARAQIQGQAPGQGQAAA